MIEKEVTLVDVDEAIDVHCIVCGELMKPVTTTFYAEYKNYGVKVHNVRAYRCDCCTDQECYSSKTAEMIENAVWDVAEDDI